MWFDFLVYAAEAVLLSGLYKHVQIDLPAATGTTDETNTQA